MNGLRFIVEIESWGNWEAEESFADPSEARQFARANFPHNTWRVWDYDQSVVIALHENGMLESMSEEVERFRQNDRWLNRFAEERQRRNERRVNVAHWQEEEIQRGRGRGTFNNMLNAAQRHHRRYDLLQGLDDDDEVLTTERVCWQKEGF